MDIYCLKGKSLKYIYRYAGTIYTIIIPDIYIYIYYPEKTPDIYIYIYWKYFVKEKTNPHSPRIF